MRAVATTFLFAVPFLFAAIAEAGGGPFPPTLDAIQDNVFTPSCSQSFCHGEASSADLNLEEGNSWSNLVNVPSVELAGWDRVEPFDPDMSYLICKLENCPSIIGSQMPLIGDLLTQDVIDVIREWILLGAPENPPVGVESNSWGRIKTLYRD